MQMRRGADDALMPTRRMAEGMRWRPESDTGRSRGWLLGTPAQRMEQGHPCTGFLGEEGSVSALISPVAFATSGAVHLTDPVPAPVSCRRAAQNGSDWT